MGLYEVMQERYLLLPKCLWQVLKKVIAPHIERPKDELLK